MSAKKTALSQKNLLFTCLAVLVLALALFSFLRPAPSVSENADQALLEGTYYVEIDVKDYGTIQAELYADTAPITVTNFMELVRSGFYDGLTFHRIISGFMIQGGDPNGNGTGGSGKPIKGEFSANGVDNPLLHTRGVLSMARSSLPDSASSQFFIMHEDAPHLDGSYAAFGKVISGIEVVDAICENTPVIDRNGTVEKENQPVITSIREIENPLS
ncbi:MAG: peptidylprolyl isomerase [Clostridia bacterium]|nr:peptidylprolyl isomerase [Clostridia bacterium]MBR2286693.1 peptidylprolyl isomerase [Clostridia bacterium]